jgi:hypothetical protein
LCQHPLSFLYINDLLFNSISNRQGLALQQGEKWPENDKSLPPQMNLALDIEWLSHRAVGQLDEHDRGLALLSWDSSAVLTDTLEIQLSDQGCRDH